jgi:hypothetical protein
LILGSCEEIGLDNNVIDRGLYSGPVVYRKYLYLKDSTEPTLSTSTVENQVKLLEDKQGLFIENDSIKYYFDTDNNIEITTEYGYIKYKRTNNSIDVNNRSEFKYTDSTVVNLGNGTLKKQ